MSDVVQESIVVSADPDAVMDVIADFDTYTEWQEDMREVDVLERDGDGWGTKVRYVVDARIMTVEMVLAYSYDNNEMRWELVESPQLHRNEGRYLLQDQGDGTTRVTYELEIEPAIRVPGPLRRQAAKRIVSAALNGMKRRAEALG